MQIIMITVTSINSIIDGAIASNFISSASLAAIALFLPVVRTLDTVNAIFLGGSQILCGRYIGKNQLEKANAVFTTDFCFLFLFGLTATLSCLFFCRPIASLFVHDATLLSALSDYIYGYSFGILPLLFIPQLTAFLQMERQEVRTYVGMGAMIVLNISLDIVFVSVLHMGMFGLGLATTVSNLVFFLILLTYYFRHTASLHFVRKGFQPRELASIILVGFPGAVNQLGQTIRSIVLNTIMLIFVGNDGISAFSAVYSFGCLYWAVSGGVSTAVRVLASIYAGEEDRTGLKTLMRTALLKGTALVCLAAAVFLLLASPSARLFFKPSDGSLYDMTRAGFLLFPLTMPFSCICCVFSCYYQCLGRMRIVNLLTFVDGLLGVVLFSHLLVPGLGMNGIWLAHIASGILTMLVIFGYTVLYRKGLPRSLTDLLVLPDSFGAPEENRIDLSVADMADVMNLSERVVGFSRSHGIDERRSMWSGLCIEEMAGNIVQHGFDGRKTYSIDVHVVYRTDGILLIRMKDNCRPFNPKEVQNLLDPEDPTKNIGLRLISQAAKTMSYNNCLGINILTITI